MAHLFQQFQKIWMIFEIDNKSRILALWKNSYSLYPQIRLIPLSMLWNFDPKICFLDPTSNKFHNQPDTIGSSSESSSHACCGLFSLASQFSTNSVQCNLMYCVVQCVPLLTALCSSANNVHST